MGHLQGIVVRIKTSDKEWAGTADPMYVGLFGKTGGREFSLDVRGSKEFKAGSDATYVLGAVWDEDAIAGAKHPFESGTESQRWNDPSKDSLQLESIEYVYLRKAGSRTEKSDDAYAMAQAQVTLYAHTPDKRTFARQQEVGLANEYGLQVWLQEVL